MVTLLMLFEVAVVVELHDELLILLEEDRIGLSVPVAFQYPDPAARFGLAPFGYFLSLGVKKYHSFSPQIALPKRCNN